MNTGSHFLREVSGMSRIGFSGRFLIPVVAASGLLICAMPTGAAEGEEALSYTIVDTRQTDCIGISDSIKECPRPDEKGFGQDAQYRGTAPDYTDNKDGTVTDNNTRLMWTQTVDINGDGLIGAQDKLSYSEALTYAMNQNIAGYSDWRLPTIKELYSLILFDGEDPSGLSADGEVSVVPFIDHSVFGFNSGDLESGERLIDSQYVSSTRYVSTTMKGDETVFGVNFIDGRIKGYGTKGRNGKPKTFYVQLVRGNTDYGINQFVSESPDTVTDKATSLVWQKKDSVMGMDWSSALSYCENLNLAGRSDWRLPDVKELQSIVDYSRAPSVTNSAAIDPLFSATSIVNEAGKIDYPNYWSSTTHKNMKNGRNAAYVAFGRSMGYMNNNWMDVHGAGSQRSDPKTGSASQFPTGKGPQGDAIRIQNYVRCVSGGATQFVQQPEGSKRDGMVYTVTAGDNDRQSQNGMQRGQKGSVDALPGMGTDQGGRGKAQRRGGDPFTMMDTNNDGKLSKDEVKGPLARDFSRIDRNGDGFISEDEMPEPPGRR